MRPKGAHGAVASPKGNSSTGRASVSKTEGWGFKSLLPCGFSQSGGCVPSFAAVEKEKGTSVADKEDVDSGDESGDPAADPDGLQPRGSHALEPADPAVGGVPADAEEPTFRDRERRVAEGDDLDRETDPDELSANGIDETDETDDQDKQLVTVGGSPQERTASAGDEAATVPRDRAKKDKATRRQKQEVDKDRRTGPVKFVRESVGELQKVVYPTGQQLINYFIVVLIFVLFIIAIVSVLDLAFGKAIIAVFS